MKEVKAIDLFSNLVNFFKLSANFQILLFVFFAFVYERFLSIKRMYWRKSIQNRRYIYQIWFSKVYRLFMKKLTFILFVNSLFVYIT